MNGHGLTPEDLKQKYAAEIAEVATFETHGVSEQTAIDYLKTPEGKIYWQTLVNTNPNAPIDRISDLAIEQITSGRELPRMEIIDEPLVKLSASGKGFHPQSPYYAKLADVDGTLASNHSINDRFGLPIKSEAPVYDASQVRPHGPTRVFVSQVAPTSELYGQVKHAGGATQYLVLDTNQFTRPELLRNYGNDLALQNEFVVGKGLGAPIAAAAIDPRGLRSGLVGGAGVLGAGVTAYDAITTATRANELSDQGNTIGAQSQVMQFGARNVGGWTGAVIGAQVGAAAGVETGPGMVLTSIAGAALFAWGADKTVDWIEQNKINTQTDRNGNTWRFDPKQQDGGWTREVVDAFAERGLSRTHTETASPELANELNYKASSVAVQLRLATPDTPIDPYRIAADASDMPRSLRDSTWARNPETRQWTREVADGLIDRSMHTSTQTATPEKAAELDAYAQSVIAYNASRSPAAIARDFEQRHTQSGWAQYGPVPEAVTQARRAEAPLQSTRGEEAPVSSQPAAPTRTPTDPDHSDHTLLEKIREGVRGINQQLGKSWGEDSDRLSASLLVAAKEQGWSGEDSISVAFSLEAKRGPAGHFVHMARTGGNVSGDPSSNRASVVTEEARAQPVEESYQQVQTIAVQQELERQQALTRGPDDPTRSGPTR